MAGRRLARSWPRGATLMEAAGYLLASHVPVAALPHGPWLVRRAAGWPLERPHEALDLAQAEMSPALAGQWLAEARAHAARLGPPAGLLRKLNVLNDGVLRGEESASRRLGRVGVGPDPSALVLVDFAGWCGVDLAFDVVPGARRAHPPGRVYARDVDDVRSARALARKYLIEMGGLVRADLLREDLGAVRLDPGAGELEVRQILDLDGEKGWLWPFHRHTPLVRALRRIGALGAPVPLSRVPAAVRRGVLQRRPPFPGRWPLPEAGLRVWLARQSDWVLSADDLVMPVGPPEPVRPRDEVLVAVLGGLPEPLIWTDVMAALQERGLTFGNSAQLLYSSPLVHRDERGYMLVTAP